MSSLVISHMGANLGERPILHDIDFAVNSGEVVALLGRNGMGKTTTLKTVMGVVAMTRGEIVLEGRRLNRMTTHQRRRAGLMYVPEDGGVFQTLTVEENLRVGAARPVKGVLGPFPELEPLWHRTAALLSGGERKILAFGRAWLSDARWFLIDEPSLGLAPAVIKRLTEAIKTLKDKGSVLLVEQNVRLAEAVSDRYVLIVLGRVAASGAMSDLRQSAAYAEGLVNLAGGIYDTQSSS
ncbi:MAG: ABC transporter ATP-binding protein [Thermaerobacter sp.]|nr:ABC transporter ATP-binding protein [Thermaerobacter sp.]